MRGRTDVLDFLVPIDGASSFVSVAEALLEAATDPEDTATGRAVRRAMQAVESRLKDSSRPLMTTEQAQVYDRIKRVGSRRIEPRAPTHGRTPDFVEPLVLAVYARAPAALQ